MSYELRPVETSDEWAAMHDIRRATLFVAGRHEAPVTYDDKHPDDWDPANQCFLFLLDGRPVGVARLDRRGANDGIVRLVAIEPRLQRPWARDE